MKKNLLSLVVIIISSTCSSDIEPTIIPEPVVDKVAFEQVVDDGKIYTSNDFFMQDLRNTRNITYLNLLEQQKDGMVFGVQMKTT
jgi:hypothetical protein|tara:strand:+ start:624 stop:878 length:255 start_codon:yes stop_codon:yes gene_type:complete